MIDLDALREINAACLQLDGLDHLLGTLAADSTDQLPHYGAYVAIQAAVRDVKRRLGGIVVVPANGGQP